MATKISAVIPTRSEGEELQKTIDSFWAGGADEIIVVDDANELDPIDGVELIKTDHPEGPGYCRNVGAQAASGDVVILSDSHVRVPEGGLRGFADQAAAFDGMVCAPIQPLDGDRQWTGYAGTIKRIKAGYDVSYNMHKIDSPTGLIGSVYALSKDVYEAMAGFPPTLSWGYNEQAMSMACHFAGLKIEVGDMIAKHMFKKRFNYPTRQSYAHANRVLVHWMLFEQEEFEKTWAPIFKEHLGRGWQAAQSHLERLEPYRKVYKERKVITDAQFYDIVGGPPEVATFAASRRKDSPREPAKPQQQGGPVDRTRPAKVAVYTAFHKDRDWSMRFYETALQHGGYMPSKIVTMRDSDGRKDVEGILHDNAVHLRADSVCGSGSEAISNHLASMWNQVINSDAFEGVDYVLSLEDDVVPNELFLARMVMQMDSDSNIGVVGLPVDSRKGHLMVYRLKSVDPFLLDRKRRYRKMDGLNDVGSVSLSCTLIRASLLRNFRFTGTPNPGKKHRAFGHEWSLMKMCHRLGMRVTCDFGIGVKHMKGPDDFPSAGRQVLNFAGAVGRAVKQAVAGGRVAVDQETRDERIKICEGCEQLRGVRCAKCGCNTVAKVALATEKCPEGKW